jgi:hypothetical protein
VRYEEDELGNTLGVSPAVLAVLDHIPARGNLMWVTAHPEDAETYGTPVRLDVMAFSRIVAIDHCGGFLLLAGPPSRYARYMPVEAEATPTREETDALPDPPLARVALQRYTRQTLWRVRYYVDPARGPALDDATLNVVAETLGQAATAVEQLGYCVIEVELIAEVDAIAGEVCADIIRTSTPAQIAAARG